jgi:hypothetical protein
MPVNTIGMVGAARCNVAMATVPPVQRTTSGASATNATFLRMRSGSPALQR